MAVKTAKGNELPFGDYHYDAIPEEMKSLDQWVCHIKKIPYNPQTGQRANPADSVSGVPFDVAVSGLTRGKYDGIGFILADNGIVGIDLDHCLDSETGNIEEWALEIINAIDSYTELSPSGTGFHIFAKGDIPANGRRKGQLEIYKSKRYLTVTGIPFGESKEIAYREKEVLSLYQSLFLEKDSDTETLDLDVESETDDFSDIVLIEKAKASENGETFKKLMIGEWQGDYPSQSEADLALCVLLAFWTGKDKIQMDRLFRSSGLMRDKWDEKRGKYTYGQKTINKAVSNCKNTYGDNTMIPPKENADYQVYSVVDLLEEDIPPIKWIVNGLIPEGLTIIAAPPKSGKSWWALDLSLSVARGLPFLNRPTTKGKVLYLALEDGKRRIQSRTKKLLQADNTLPHGFTCVHNIEPIGNGFEERFEKFMNDANYPNLVIIDTFEKIRGSADTKNLYKQDYKDAGLIKSMADKYGIAIIIIHHTRKSKDDADPFAQISGSFGIMGAVDSAMVIDKAKRNDNRATLMVTGRDIGRQELIVEFDAQQSRWNFISEDLAETRRVEEYNKSPIVQTIKELTGFGAVWKGTSSELAEEVKKRTGISMEAQEVGRQIGRLISELSEYDLIDYSVTNHGNRKFHKFEPYYDELLL